MPVFGLEVCRDRNGLAVIDHVRYALVVQPKTTWADARAVVEATQILVGLVEEMAQEAAKLKGGRQSAPAQIRSLFIFY